MVERNMRHVCVLGSLLALSSICSVHAFGGCERTWVCNNQEEPQKLTGQVEHVDAAGFCAHGHAQYTHGGCDFTDCGENTGPCQCISEKVARENQHRGLYVIMGV